jgi:hypothetical protein
MKWWYKTTGDASVFQKSKEIQRHLINILAINGAFSSTDLYKDDNSFYLRTSNNKILTQFLRHYKFESMVFDPPESLTIVYSSSVPTIKSGGD